ncbi:MAG: aminotransferase class V-fold PLP-dependent enzyme [Rhodothermales bacterium]
MAPRLDHAHHAASQTEFMMLDRMEITDRLDAFARAGRALEADASTRDALWAMTHAVARRYVEDVDTLPAFTTHTGREPVPPIGPGAMSIHAVRRYLEGEIFHGGASPSAPGHFAYLTGGGLFHAALGDYLAAATNAYSGMAQTGPGLVQLENAMVRWTADLVGYPDTAGGYLASGGSLAILSAIAAAREAHGLRAADYHRAVVYLTEQTNPVMDKALRVAGMAEAIIRRVAMDERHRMRPDALSQAIQADREAGLLPWMVAPTAGTTDTGAIDPIAPLSDIAREAGCWLHVDAAYGGFFLLTDEGRRRMSGIERSDSVILNPHKSLFLPWGLGILLVRETRFLLPPHDLTGACLQDAANQASLSPGELSPELSRPFRALRMWLPLALLGTDPFRAALEEKLLLARYFHQRIAEAGFEVGPAPDLSVVAFRRAPAGASAEEADRLNEAIVDRLQRDGRVFLSSTRIDGRFTIRLAVLGYRTHRAQVDLAIQLLRDAADALEPGTRAPTSAANPP